MKKLLLAILTGHAFVAFSQNPNISAERPNLFDRRINNTPNSEWFKDKRTIYLLDQFYIINGKQVYGTPFLYYEWQNGTIITSDGREYNTYKVKYDAYNQSVYFSDGKDSLEVADEVKEFILITVYPDTITKSRFVNANQYRKEKKPMFYEVLIDDAKGQLLKFNKKIVTVPAKGVASSETRNIFDLQFTYFYYDKNKKAINEIKSTGANIVSILELDENAKTSLQPQTVNFLNESDVLNFFHQYFKLGSK